ncbi:MAG: WYL domain-containing protein [Dysosmobacter sp.]|nr:WYL domain-containing protein [Dysosmobacter sp.]
MEQASEAKSARLLDIYARLMAGQVLNKTALAEEYGVTLRSIQRDMESLRFFLMEKGLPQEVIYDRSMKGYRMVNSVPSGLSNSEILAVCKILLESRSMRRDEMLPILDKLVECAVPQEQRRAVKELIANEKLHYIEPHHGKSILNGLWDIGQAVKEHRVMEIEYERMKEPKLVRRRVQPVGIMFSEYYFYLTAFLENKESFENPDDLFPTIYRIDRIRRFKVLDEHFHVPYSERFEEGEFRKRVQFMYGGKLQHIKFHYTGPSLEAVLDRLPTAKVINEDGVGWTVEAEVFGKGIDMWLRSQGSHIERVDI